jgi:hypothetical protein
MNLQALDKWHRTKPGFLVFAILEGFAAYGFASLAIDRGNLWWYLLTIVAFAGSVQNIVKLIIEIGKRSRK